MTMKKRLTEIIAARTKVVIAAPRKVRKVKATIYHWNTRISLRSQAWTKFFGTEEDIPVGEGYCCPTTCLKVRLVKSSIYFFYLFAYRIVRRHLGFGWYFFRDQSWEEK